MLPGAPELNRQLALTAQALGEFAPNPGVQGGIRRSTQFFDFLNPALRFVAPAQTVCNYATLLARNAQDHLSISPDGIGTAQRFIVMSAGQTEPYLGDQRPEQRERPLVPPRPTRRRASRDNNYLHANPYPNTASPGQTARVRGRQRAIHPEPGA